MTTLKNTFHNTEYHSTKDIDEIERIASTPPWERTKAEKAFIRRVHKALCGSKDCQCGDDLGRRE